jgi:hypothetical protein
MLSNEKNTPGPRAEISILVSRTNASETSSTPISMKNLLLMLTAKDKPAPSGKVAGESRFLTRTASEFV